jgi:hypothetical protein
MQQLRLAKTVLVCLAVFAGPMAVAASDAPASVYAVKAAILYKITKFVSWPETAYATPDDRLSICLAKNSPFNSAMRSLHGRSVRGRIIEVVTFATPKELGAECQVLFIGQAKDEQVRLLLNQIAGKPVLTVGEGDGFAKRGGIIRMQVESSRINFAINIAASERAGLDISAQLLQLAKIVDGDGV